VKWTSRASETRCQSLIALGSKGLVFGPSRAKTRVRARADRLPSLTRVKSEKSEKLEARAGHNQRGGDRQGERAIRGEVRNGSFSAAATSRTILTRQWTPRTTRAI
jgi:hypothetical protein